MRRMKIWIVFCVCLLLGLAAGLGVTSAELWGLKNHFEPHNGDVTPLQKVAKHGQRPKAEVLDGEVFNFNTMERHATREHTFRVKNVGDGLLDLKHDREAVSCGLCIECDFRSASLAPGEVAEVVVRYSTRKEASEFSESASILTNDLRRPKIELRIEGHVVHSMRVLPERLAMTSISAAEGDAHDVKLYGFVQEPVEVERFDLLDRDSANLFEISVRNLTSTELDEIPGSRSGVAVNVRVKPGAPLGPIRQTLRLLTNITDSSRLEIPIEGRVVSDINVFGTKYVPDVNLVRFGPVDRTSGPKTMLFIQVKGPYRDQTELSIASITPPRTIRATLGPRRSGEGDQVYLYPLTIEVAEDAITIPMIDGKQPYAEIMIHTTHPDAKQLPIYVEYTVAN